MPLNFGGQKRSGAFDTVWLSAGVVADAVLISKRRGDAPGTEKAGGMLREAPRAAAEAAGSYGSMVPPVVARLGRGLRQARPRAV